MSKKSAVYRLASFSLQQACLIGCVLRWRRLVNACRIGCWQNLGAVCFWQPIQFGLNLVVIAALRVEYRV